MSLDDFLRSFQCQNSEPAIQIAVGTKICRERNRKRPTEGTVDEFQEDITSLQENMVK